MSDVSTTDHPTAGTTAPSVAGHRSVYPCLRYADAPRALEDLATVLGFEVTARYDAPDGTVSHAEVTLGGGTVMLGSARDDDLGLVPARSGEPTAACVYVAVDDDGLHAIDRRVREAGWPVVRPLAEEDHGPSLTCRDPQGVIWSLGTYRP